MDKTITNWVFKLTNKNEDNKIKRDKTNILTPSSSKTNN